MRINIIDKVDCCGCTACASACPKSAITMSADGFGFKIPEVNEDLCIDCGRCLKVCQFNKNYNRYSNFEKPIVYGVRHNDEQELAKSQSGAASWAIIQTFLESAGIVYGASFENVYHVSHTKAINLFEAQKFRGSKYVQSDLDGVFSSIKNDLKDGNRVLFIGTGCQVAGLKSYIPIALHDKLFTVDLVCHGTPSPAVWTEYIKYLENKHKSKATNAAFRNKRFGWHSHIETIKMKNQVRELENTSFRKLFYDHVIVRKSCTKCPFTNIHRVSDITIADFWGWEKYYTEWNDNMGVNVLFVNSEKGMRLFKQMSPYISSIKSSLEKCIQPQMKAPITANYNIMEHAESLFRKGGYKALACRYGDLNPLFRMKTFIGNSLRKIGIRR